MEVVVGNPAASGEKLEGELHRGKHQVALEGLEVGAALMSGALEGPSSYFMKSPPVQYTDDEAHDAVEEFIARYAGKRDKVEARMAELAESVTQPAPLPTSDGTPAAPTEVAPSVNGHGK